MGVGVCGVVAGVNGMGAGGVVWMTLCVLENVSVLPTLTKSLTSFLGNPVRILYSEGKNFFAPKKFIRS